MHVQRSVDKETSYEAYCPKCHDQIEGLQGCYLKYGFDGFDEFVNAIILKRLSDIMDKHLN